MKLSKKAKLVVALAVTMLGAGNTLAMHQQIRRGHVAAPHVHTVDGTTIVRTSLKAN